MVRNAASTGTESRQGDKPTTRVQQQERTRARLLLAGEQAYLEKGFHGATAAEIARRAGYSTGALYSNFASKDDLLLGVLDQHVAGDVEQLGTAVRAAASVAEVVDKVSGWFGDMFRNDPRWRVLEVELAIAGLSKPELAARLRERQRGFTRGVAKLLRGQADRLGAALPLREEMLAEALLSLGDGLSVHALLDPDIDATTVFARGLTVLLGAGDSVPGDRG
ncbi:TetR/AcrR family transcriptional regulator [Mycobacterium sp. SMC-11]|uniref:TetR/AcrR family transcriptional regulator n=1 Tax=Mycobacterium sp. SMC-11 TaxID=3385969 RepID=UPI00390CC3E5